MPHFVLNGAFIVFKMLDFVLFLNSNQKKVH